MCSETPQSDRVDRNATVSRERISQSIYGLERKRIERPIGREKSGKVTLKRKGRAMQSSKQTTVTWPSTHSHRESQSRKHPTNQKFTIVKLEASVLEQISANKIQVVTIIALHSWPSGVSAPAIHAPSRASVYVSSIREPTRFHQSLKPNHSRTHIDYFLERGTVLHRDH
jgi:hypothetical protein